MAKFLVRPSDLAHTLSIPVNAIHALANGGYLCTVKVKPGGYKVVKVSPPERLPTRIVDRISIALWLLGLDKHRYIPNFNVYVEMEIQRIAKLPIIQRTEQAIKLIRRYRDAEEIMVAVALARADDIAAVETKRLGAGFKDRLQYLAGIEVRARRRAREQSQAQAHPNPSQVHPSFEPIPKVSPVESPRKRR